ncbi:MAG: ANTAR domain-containing protein [Oscillospiraceae bacterium]|nr:ANTAR domain-containing protein [Oscillospiraceae bacterium]
MKRTAIVADDEPIIRLDLAQMLEELDFEVLGSAADGFDAVELCRAHRPDVALLDVNMPVFEGLGAAQTILEESLAGCVVIVTAFDDRELIDRAGAIGVTGYLVKPIEERLLLPTIEVALAQGRRLADAQREAEEARRRLRERDTVDRAKAALAAEKGVSEAEALRLLQGMAMDKRCSLLYLAQAVVEKNSQRELVNRAKTLLMQTRGLSEPAAYKAVQSLARAMGVGLDKAAREILEGRRRP